MLAQSSSRALLNAAIKGFFDIVILFLNFGANPNKIDPINGSSALHEAVRYNDINDEKNRIERLKIVKFLAMFGASPELKNLRNEVRITGYYNQFFS